MVYKAEHPVAIVILNWNGRKYLEQFLPSVLQNSPNCDVIVADNASTDDSVAFVRTNFQAVKIIQNSGNLGFCEGYNQALKQIEAKYYVLLNSDVQVTPGWVAPIVKLLENDPQISAVQPKIKAFHEPYSLEYAGAGGGFIDHFGYPFCRGRLFDTLETDKGQYNDIAEIFWATGACMFVRAELFHKLGGLEPAFFAHMEEIDLCWRLQNAGYKIMYCGQSEVFHVGGGTLHKSNPRKTFLNFRNGLALLYKNLPANVFFSTLFIRVLLDWVSAVKFLLSGQTGDAEAIIKAHVEVFNKRKYWKQRRRLQPIKKEFHALKGVYNGSIVWEYFVRGRKTFTKLFNG
ncbi:glycosyltransferase family 2 protein [Adhaeribacter terreus]|uniref:Glycosyltransferase family 2 protein n=1 Tax=Adhaeribacter terreus TaxID=529703 RepID=A0ABW0EBK6_9BACT